MYTHKGKVVYERAKRYFDWAAVNRVITAVWLDDPAEEKDVADHLQACDRIGESIYHQFRKGERYIRKSPRLSNYAYRVCRSLSGNAIRIAYYLPESIGEQIRNDLKPFLFAMIRLL